MTFVRATAPRVLLTVIATAGITTVAGASGAKTVFASNVACSAASLVTAVTAANGGTDGGVINLAPGCTYTFTAANNNSDGEDALPDMTGNLTINGNGATITRSASAPDFRFIIVDNGGSLAINNLTLSNGRADAQPHGGGAILNRSQLSVTGVTFLNNTAPYDGAGAVGGGAIDNHDSGNATVTQSTFTGNSAIEGGAIEDEATVGGHGLTVTQSTFTNNSTSSFGGSNGPYGGGAIENQAGGSDTITANTFTGNSAIEGGGIANAGTMSVTNNTLYNNTAGANGGGGIQNYGTMTIMETTLSGNSSAGGGADLHVFQPTATPPATAPTTVTTISQSIVANGVSSANCSGNATITDGGYNLDDGTSCGFTGTGSINSTDPQLGTLQDNGGPTHTMAPASGSPVVNAIPSASCGTTSDQRGATRPQGSGCDIGSVEYVNRTATTTSVSAAPNPVGTNQPVTYTATTSPAASGGSVAFSDGSSAIAGCQSQPVSSGSATCTQTYGGAGSHSISAVFSGDAYHTGSTSSAVTVTVTAAAPPPPPPAFSAKNVGAPSVTVAPDGSQLVFWKGSANHLFEAWYSGGSWHGPADLTASAFGGQARLSSAPSAAMTADGSTQLVFWQGAGGHLYEGWYAAGSWHGPLDITGSSLGGAAPLASSPTVAVTPDGSAQLVYWRSAANHIMEAWYAGGGWNGPLDLTSVLGGAATTGAAPSATVTRDGSTQLLFWQGAGGHLVEGWYSNGWHGPLDVTGSVFGGAAPLTSSPSVTTTPDGSSQLVYWQGAGGRLMEAWWAGARWNGPLDITDSQLGGAGPLTSAPSAMVTPNGSTQLVFWQGAGQSLMEAWYTGHWNGPANFSG